MGRRWTQCRQCGYDLLGCSGGVCPECGVHVGDADDAVSLRARRWARLRMLSGVAAAGAVSLAGGLILLWTIVVIRA